VSDHEERDVLVKREDRFTTITMNRPQRRNALSAEHMAALLSAFRSVGESDARGVILAGNGPVFCSGHDFADVAGADLRSVRALVDLCIELMETIQAIPQVVIARVHGLATAAGCQLVATADIAVAADTAQFAIPGGRTGWFCHTPLVAVARNVGRKRALEMAFSGEPIDARTAADWGLINAAVPPDELEAATLDLLTRCTRGSSLSKGLGKRAFYTQVDLDQPKAYAHALEVMAASSQTHDAQEGISAFLEHRRPRYENR